MNIFNLLILIIIYAVTGYWTGHFLSWAYGKLSAFFRGQQ